MTQITVGMGELEMSCDPDSMLITYALGSCVAVVVHEPVRLVGGMIHYLLPLSAITPERAKARPAMFADTEELGHIAREVLGVAFAGPRAVAVELVFHGEFAA